MLNDVNNINVLVLAYLGDTVFENYIRKYLITKGIGNVNMLQKEAVNYVSAKSQAIFFKKMMEANILNKDEISVMMRARNYKSNSHPRNCDILTYKHATALEAVIGYLSILKREDRINELMKFVIGE